MVTVAIVGLDGAGKTTVTHRLVDELPFETVCLYMGMNPASSNVSLPSTRLVHAFKRRAAADGPAGSASMHSLSQRTRKRGRGWSAVRLVNRMAEESVRHGLAWFQQRRRRLVVTDRDFYIDYSAAAKQPIAVFDRVHLWFLRSVLPRPDLVVWLDAPPAVLFERQPEVPVSYLERRRVRMGELRSEFEHFEVVDADRSEDLVYQAVERLVIAECEGRRIRMRDGAPQR